MAPRPGGMPGTGAGGARKRFNRMNTLEWLRSLIIIGREKDDEGDDGDDGQEDDQGGDDGQDDGDDDEGGDDGDDSAGKEHDDSPEGLKKALEASKKALREERQARRKAEREARKATKKKAEVRDEKDLEKTKTALETETQKTAKLSTKLLDRSRDTAILAAARKAGFIDETDALTDEVRRDVDFDQDEDDPSDIEIDADSVKDAVQSLIDKKPHLVGKNSDGSSTQQSGTRMGKKKPADSDKITEEKLLADYPSLRV